MGEEMGDVDGEEVATVGCAVVDEGDVAVVAVAVDDTISVGVDPTELLLPIKATAAVEEPVGHSRT